MLNLIHHDIDNVMIFLMNHYHRNYLFYEVNVRVFFEILKNITHIVKFLLEVFGQILNPIKKMVN